MHTDPGSPSWPNLVPDQLSWHWENHLRPRLDGLGDAEYLWEPVPGCWSVREVGTSTAPLHMGSGRWRVEYARPEPDPPPVTTIAWRLAHLVVGVLGERVASHFGGPPTSYAEHDYAGTAAGALQQLDAAYTAWDAGVRGLGAEGLARPCGPAEGPWSQATLAELVLHINREVLHHGAEVLLLRDLYRSRPPAAPPRGGLT